MKQFIVAVLGLVLFAVGSTYAVGGCPSCTTSVSKVTKSAKKNDDWAAKAKRYEKYAANYDKRAAKLDAEGKKAAAAALRKKAAAKRKMAKAFATGDKKLLEEGRADYRAAKKEFNATDVGKVLAAKYAARKAARKAAKAAKNK